MDVHEYPGEFHGIFLWPHIQSERGFHVNAAVNIYVNIP